MKNIDSNFRRLLLATAVAVAAMSLALGCGDDGSDGGDAPDGPEIVDVAGLSAASERLGHPIYWVGVRDGTDLELAESDSGRVYVRYLDEGSKAGVRSSEYLTVVTYVGDGAAALRRAARERPRAELARTDDGALMLIDPETPRSVRIARPGSDHQVEVYSPDVEQGLRLAKEGEVEPVP